MKKKTNKIFDKIENVRKKNNKNWMNILRVAYDSNPKKTILILNNILSKDSELIKLASQLKKIAKE
jgi:hypothetical protein